MKNYWVIPVTILLCSSSLPFQSWSQVGQLRRLGGAVGSMGRGGGLSGGKADSLQHRTGKEDSIAIKFRWLDNSRFQLLDSTVQEFSLRFPLTWNQVHLGNLGNPVENRFFSPILRSGWDPGFHGFDPYLFRADDTRFYNTTRPYSEIGYIIGSQSEQMIHLLQTQNIKPGWNLAFQYRLINAPGTFQNQSTNHNNYRVTSWYQSPGKRYENFFMILGNKFESGENGGILTDGNYLDSSVFLTSRFGIPTQLGGSSLASRNFFRSNISTGSFYTNAVYLFRQHYDLGQRDSIVVNDSTTIRLFYPRIRFEHTISLNTYYYRYKDNQADSSYYSSSYPLKVPASGGKIFLDDRWQETINSFSIYTFPDAKNSLQYLKLGVTLQQLQGTFDSGAARNRYSNLWVSGEYRNRTRNKKWEIAALGDLYLSGWNSGDYRALFSLERFLPAKGAGVTLGVENVNRKPSFNFYPTSSFFLDQPKSWNKENHIRVFASLTQPQWSLSAQYLLLNNYTYYRQYFQVEQESSLFTVLQLNGFKDFRLGRKGWHWRTWLTLQQKTGSAAVNLPLLSLRNQLAYDGSFGFRNLRISTGLEFRYFTPYAANQYSPVTGQFFYQDRETVRLRAPELAAYAHFRIRAFVTYIRAENLNAFNFTSGGFTKNNVLLPNYPSPGLLIRVGIFWSFVN